MYAMKASWVGQTFALATSSDSGGRKSRIRRSKEERKAMVESFIKRYQILNDGNFPSLNLTHKEVGGSFYTVREIVREIIQENKVLGPAKLNSEVQKGGMIAEEYLADSVTPDAQVLFSVNELDVSEHKKNGSLGLTLQGSDYCSNNQDLDRVGSSGDHLTTEVIEDLDEMACKKSPSENDQKYVSLQLPFISVGQRMKENHMECDLLANGSHTTGAFEESDELSGEGSVNDTSEGDEQVEIVGACNSKLTLPTKELEVETFPLRPAIKDIDDLSTASTGSQNLNGTVSNFGSKQDEISDSNPDLQNFSSPDSLSCTMIGKGTDASAHPNSDPGKVVQHAEINGKRTQNKEAEISNKSLEMLDSSTIKEECPSLDQAFMGNIASCSGSSSKTVDQMKGIDEIQSTNAPMGTTYKEASSSKNVSKGPELTAANGKYVRRDNKATIEVCPTVDRIDLESWESKRPSNKGANPLLTFFKAFVDAFVKFWSE